jgi:hypothetical protein
MIIAIVLISVAMSFLPHPPQTDKSRSVSPEHVGLEEAWRIQEITDVARQDMYREIRSRVSGDGE